MYSFYFDFTFMVLAQIEHDVILTLIERYYINVIIESYLDINNTVTTLKPRRVLTGRR